MLWPRPPDAPPGSAPERAGWLSGRPDGRPDDRQIERRSVPTRVDPRTRQHQSVIMLHPAFYAPTLGAAVPPFWYALAAVLIITPLYFLLSRPRKKRADSKWKG